MKNKHVNESDGTARAHGTRQRGSPDSEGLRTSVQMSQGDCGHSAVPHHMAGGDTVGPHSIQASPRAGRAVPLSVKEPGPHQPREGASTVKSPPSPPQLTARESTGSQGPASPSSDHPHCLEARGGLAPLLHPRRLCLRREARPKESGKGPRLCLLPSTHKSQLCRLGVHSSQ